MEERKTVNVVLACADGKHKGEIPVQQRAEREKDPQTGKERLQSNPYVLQLTFGGKVEDGETLEQAIERECAEELGVEFAKQFNVFPLQLFHTAEFVFKERLFKGYSYFGTLTTKQFATISLHSAAERIVWIQESDLQNIEPLDKTDKSQNPQIKSVMFADFIEALQILYRDPHYAMLLV